MEVETPWIHQCQRVRVASAMLCVLLSWHGYVCLVDVQVCCAQWLSGAPKSPRNTENFACDCP